MPNNRKVTSGDLNAFVAGLASAECLSVLKLDISYTKVAAPVVLELSQHLSAQRGLTRLILGFSGIAMDEGALTALGECLSKLILLEKLELALRKTGLGDAGVEVLAKGVPRGLQKFGFNCHSNPAVTDAGLEALCSALRGRTELKGVALNFQGTRITDTGLDFFVDARGTCRWTLDAQESKVSYAAARQYAGVRRDFLPERVQTVVNFIMWLCAAFACCCSCFMGGEAAGHR
mmetsp:Transcript_25746/g.58476  ORF Transcript_25746/g.58476 Transcript_25746/m.58476 type:complete len:233 (-) Transcript_25746:43-741(-)